MTGDKLYFQPRDYVIAAIHDIKELQKGKGTFDDVPNGIIHFTVSMYNIRWGFRFSVTDIGRNRCKVEIGIAGDVQDKVDKILREYALLDSMLNINTQIELRGNAAQNSPTDICYEKMPDNPRNRRHRRRRCKRCNT